MSQPPATITFEQPTGTEGHFDLGATVQVRGVIEWPATQPGLVTTLRLQVLDHDNKDALPVALPERSHVTPTGFWWSRPFAASQVVTGGTLVASATDKDGHEVGRLEMPITIAPPTLILTIDRPAPGATFGVEEPIEVAGSLTWFPAGEDQVGRVRVTLTDLQGVPAVSGLAQRTPALPGRFAWTYLATMPTPLEQVNLIVEAVDFAATGLVNNADKPVPIAVRAARATLAMTAPPRAVPPAPAPSFGVGKPIAVAGTVTWDLGSPDYVRSVRLRLVRAGDGHLVDEQAAQVVATSVTSLAWSAVFKADQALNGARVEATAYSRFDAPVLTDFVDIEVS